MKIETATTDRLLARYSQVNIDADNVEAQGYPAMAHGFRTYGERLATELRARGCRV